MENIISFNFYTNWFVVSLLVQLLILGLFRFFGKDLVGFASLLCLVISTTLAAVQEPFWTMLAVNAIASFVAILTIAFTFREGEKSRRSMVALALILQMFFTPIVLYFLFAQWTSF